MATCYETTPAPPLRDVRRARGLGIREVARRADMDVAHLSRVERGQRGLSVDSLLRLSRVLGLRELERLLSPYARGPLDIVPTNANGQAGKPGRGGVDAGDGGNDDFH